MNKQMLMDLISEAIDRGANINIHFTQYFDVKTESNWEPVTKEQAKTMAEKFAEALGTTSVRHEEYDSSLIHSYIVKNERFYIANSYKSYMIEDINFEGVEEHA